MPSFGDRLRKEREKQGVTLDEVCVGTKVAVRFLEAIESENFEKLPGGIFNKGFVRAYAQHLGLNDDEAVADYLKAAGLEPTIPLNTTPPGEEPVKVPETKESAARLITAKTPEPKPVEVKKTVEVKKPVVKVEPKAAIVETKPPRQKSKHSKPQAKPEKKKQLAPVPTPRPEPSGEHWFPWGKVAFALLLIAFGFAMWGSFHRESEEHTSQPSKPVNQSAVPSAPVVLATASIGQSQTTPAEPSNGAFLVVVQAREDSWVSIVADGKEIMTDVLGAPAQKAVEAHKEVIIKAGNIGALDFLFNGKKLPSQGNYDEVKTLTFDPNGLQSQPVKTAGL